MKNKKIIYENYLDKIPMQRDGLRWSVDENGGIILEIENKGFANRLAQILLKKPKLSFIHLDEMGSFIWQKIDGKNNVFCIGKDVKEHFGNKAEPLYERLAQYFGVLERYGFVEFNK